MFFRKKERDQTIEKINDYLISRPFIETSKDQDIENLGVHHYKFTVDEKKLKSRGAGSALSDELAIKRAWGEFVERCSFVQVSENTLGPVTSNGYASHTEIEKAKESALAELVERDIFLSCWLLKLPAKKIDFLDAGLSLSSIAQINKLKKKNINVEFGVFGKCHGFFVGAAFISMGDKFAIALSAKGTLRQLAEHFILEASVRATEWLSPNPLSAISKLPKDTEPMDHLRVNLLTGNQEITPKYLDKNTPLRLFPNFKYKLDDLTSLNPAAEKTGYHVFRARSSECQTLWFGETNINHINFKRLEAILGRAVSYEELNQTPHPLP